MGKVIEKNRENDFTDSFRKSAYALISPINHKPPGRLQVLYAKLDQLTPFEKTIEFTKKYGIKNTAGYDESHSTILLNNEMFRDYVLFLKALK